MAKTCLHNVVQNTAKGKKKNTNVFLISVWIPKKRGGTELLVSNSLQAS